MSARSRRSSVSGANTLSDSPTRSSTSAGKHDAEPSGIGRSAPTVILRGPKPISASMFAACGAIGPSP